MAQRLILPLGVTHLFDITALDCIGLPVFMSVRPFGKTVRVHSGKGMLLEDARVGALMEAVEYATCESASGACKVQRVRLARLKQQWPSGLGLGDFAPRLGVAMDRSATLASVECEVLGTGRHALLPAELVLMPAPRHSGPRLFGSSSNGLASGNTLNEATLHALLEVIERDTVAMHIARDETQPVVLASLPPPFSGLSEAWRRRGVRLLVRHSPNFLGLPCFEAAFHEPEASPSLVLARGWGLHFDRQIALSRAICEAAQSRLAVLLMQHAELPGAAEMAQRFMPAANPERTAQLLARLNSRSRRIRFETLPDLPTPSIAVALRRLLSMLGRSGFGPVFRRRLTFTGDPAALAGLHVVKVVVARSETPVGKHPRIGPRLLARLQGA